MKNLKENIRKARPSDLDDLVRFQLAMAWESERMRLNQKTLRRGVRALFLNPGLGTYYVYTQAGKMLGCLLVLEEWSDWRARTVWWVHSVYVAPESRGRGVYKALYRYVQTKAQRRSGVAGIRLYVDLSNLRAQKVYKRLGMNGDHYRVYEWMKTH